VTRRIAINAVELAASSSGQPPAEVQLLPLGTFGGRDGQGPYKLADRAAAVTVITQTLAAAGRMELVIDYDHQSDLAAVRGVGGTAPAAGWIKGLEAREDGIWAKVEWTAAAQQRLKDREYRYLSPVFTHDPDGRVLKLLRAGLTNKPNLDLVALNAAITPQEEPVKLSAALCQALGLAAESDEAAGLAAIATLKTGASALALCAQAAGLAATATAEQVTAAIAAQKAAKPDPAQFVPVAQVTALQSQLTALQADVNGGKRKAAVAAAMQSGKLPPVLEEWAGQLWDKDQGVALAAYLEKAPVVVAAGGIVPGGTPPDNKTGLTADETAVASQLGVTAEQFKNAKG